MLVRMSRLFVWVGLLGAVAIAAAQVPPNAFLNKPVKTHRSLMNQVRSDAAVLDRYVRHFAMTPAELFAYFEELKITQLRETGTYDVYAVPSSGVIRAKKRVLKRGEWVVSDPSGQPVLLLECGNPLTRGPKEPFVMTNVSDMLVAARPDLLPLAVVPKTETETTLLTTMVMPDLSPIPVAPAPLEPTPMPREVATPSSEAEGPFGPVNGLVSLLPAVYVIGAVNFGDGGQPIPEPASLLALGLGFGTLLKLQRRRSTKS